MRRIGLGLLSLLSVSVLPSTAHADVIVSGSGTGSDGITLSASATFSISGNILTITLQNTGDSSGLDKDKSANTLTGVFFDLPDGITLTPTSATIAAGDLVQANMCDIGPCDATTTNVGGEFVYDYGSWSGHLGNNGISSSGYINADGGSGNFNGPNLDKPDSPDGINFGIIAPITAANPFKPAGKNMAENPLIEGQAVFTMMISGGSLLESQISNVSFQYGTDISEPKFVGRIHIQQVPEPAALLLFGSASILGLIRRRSRARAAARQAR